MSTSIAILKVLSACPERIAFDALKRDLSLLSSREWLARIRALAAACGPVHLFSDGLVTRDASGWAITAAGRAFIDALEQGVPVQPRVARRPELRVVGAEPAMPQADAERHPPRATPPERAAG